MRLAILHHDHGVPNNTTAKYLAQWTIEHKKNIIEYTPSFCICRVSHDICCWHKHLDNHDTNTNQRSSIYSVTLRSHGEFSNLKNGSFVSAEHDLSFEWISFVKFLLDLFSFKTAFIAENDFGSMKESVHDLRSLWMKMSFAACEAFIYVFVYLRNCT